MSRNRLGQQSRLLRCIDDPKITRGATGQWFAAQEVRKLDCLDHHAPVGAKEVPRLWWRPERHKLTSFSDLGLPKQMLSRLENAGLTTPTPIQAGAIPAALDKRDVMGLAQTGTGKTLAFGLPLIAQLMDYGTRPNRRTVRSLILAPTRELANQICDSLRQQLDGTPIKIGLVVGGVGINPQIKRLERGIDILVATPGRLIDLMDRGAMQLGETDFLVLDEADQMLDLGFIHALRKIAQWLPEKRQTMLFSATMPKQMSEIARTYLNDPVKVQVSPPGKAADKITQSVHFIAKAEKTSLLIELLDKHRDEAAIVFGRTKHGSERLMKGLVKAGYAATSVHGNKSQGQRERAIKAFRSGEVMILVATDVAARGLDIPEVRHVYNFDLPNVPENYVHRIGRTARAGMDGAAVAFCAPDEVDELKAIQKVMKISIPTASGTPWIGMDGPTPKTGGNKGKPGGGGGRGRSRRRPGGSGGAPSGGGQKPSGRPARNKGQNRSAAS